MLKSDIHSCRLRLGWKITCFVDEAQCGGFIEENMACQETSSGYSPQGGCVFYNAAYPAISLVLDECVGAVQQASPDKAHHRNQLTNQRGLASSGPASHNGQCGILSYPHYKILVHCQLGHPSWTAVVAGFFRDMISLSILTSSSCSA